MTRAEFLKQWPNATPSTLIRNGFAPLGSMEPCQRERRAKPALDKDQKAKPRSEIRVEYIVTLVVCQPNLFDSDNAISGGLKALRDAIAESLQLDDGDPRLRWHYAQCQTSGTAGVIVKIERL